MSSHPPPDSQNPWSDEPSQHNNNNTTSSYQNHNSYHAYEDQTRGPHQPQTSYQPPTHQEYAPPSYPPPNFTSPTSPQTQTQPQTHTSPFTSNAYPNDDYETEQAPPLPPRRTATDLALPTGQDRTHQIEVMQSYQAAGRKDEDDLNVEILQREFPGLDGSLIAAIYGDSKSLSATREMLGELGG